MNMKRMRGRNHRPNGGGGGNNVGGFSRNQQNGIPLNRNHVFDSSGPEMRVRGTAQQLYEKYQQLARDAQGNGDRVLGEAYYQHAEHYFRIVSAINQAQGQPNPALAGQPNGAGPPERGEYQRRDYPANEQNEPPAEARQQDNRQERRFEPRAKPEFQRPERQEPRYRPESALDTRIDISSALEAELAAAAQAAAATEAAAQAAAAQAASSRGMAERNAAPEARAIPIIHDAPPAPESAGPRPARPRGRPRLAKPKAATDPE